MTKFHKEPNPWIVGFVYCGLLGLLAFFIAGSAIALSTILRSLGMS